jgi:restriction endonuclease S subunit
MELSLDAIADLSTGLTLRGAGAALRTVEGGPHLLRIGDISETGEISIANIHPIDPDLVTDDRHRVQPGDILLANRGSRMTAARVTGEMDAVAGSQFFVIRVRPDIAILPEYLHAYINLPATQNHLQSHARGTYVSTLSIAVLRDLKVPIPPLETQQKIAQLAQLALEEQQLIAALAAKRQQLITHSLGLIVQTSLISPIQCHA